MQSSVVMPSATGEEPRGRRRTTRLFVALLAVVAVTTGSALPAAPADTAVANPLRVYVVVTDGLRPTEVDVTRMPNLTRLRDSGIWYEQARSVFVAETTPNHVAMSTGVVPSRSGIVGNAAFDPRRPRRGEQQLEQPAMLEADTTVTRLERDCGQEISTATIQSKTYLFNIFRGGAGQRQADFHWNAEPFYIPESEHALDQLTMDQLRRWVFLEQPPTPHYAFVNLGDIDRSGHVDPTGNLATGEYPAGRRGAMLETDALLGEFVEELKARGWWDDTILIVTSDHGMDYSTPESYVDFEQAFEAAGLKVGLDPDSDHVGFSENGGAALVYVHRSGLRRRVEQVITGLEGVAQVLASHSGELDRYGLEHPRSGDFVVLVDDGYRVASGNLGSSNPIPGNHGHAVTQHSVLLVAGGHAALQRAPLSVDGPRVYREGQAPRPPQDGPGNLSVAPTVSALFGLRPPSDGFDGASLSAVEAAAGGGYCAAAAGTGTTGEDEESASEADVAGDASDRTRPSLPATGGGIGAAVALLMLGAAMTWRLRRP